MGTQGENDKSVSWATVVVILGIVFFVQGLIWRTPPVFVFGAVVMAAGVGT